MPVRWLTSLKAATKTVGRMAKERVKTTRAKRDQRSCRKPWGHGKTCALAMPGASCQGGSPQTLAQRNTGGGIAPLSCAKVLSGPLQGCWAPLDVSSSSLSK